MTSSSEDEPSVSWEPRLSAAPPYPENSITESLLKGGAMFHIEDSRQKKTGMALGLAWACYAAHYDQPEFAKELNDYDDDSLSRRLPPYKEVSAAQFLSETWSTSAPEGITDSSQQHYPRSARDYHDLYRSGKATPTEVMDVILFLVRWDKSFKGEYADVFLFPKDDLVRDAAAASTLRYREDKPLGPLDGVPVAVHMELDVAGHYRSPTLTGYTYSHDRSSDCVKNWQDAGAIVIGKLNMHELGMDISTASLTPSAGLSPDRQDRPTPSHPYNESYFPGGTCGGSGVAVSFGLVTAILAGDAGGGVRVPAAYSGLYGLKPSRSTISEEPVTTTSNMMRGEPGVIAGNVEDLRLFYRVAAAREEKPRRLPIFANPRPPLKERNRVIGVCPAWFDRAEGPAKQVCQSAIQHLQQNCGYSVVEISLPCLLEGQTVHAHDALTGISGGVFCDVLASSGPNDGLRGVANFNRRRRSGRSGKIRNLFMLHMAALFRQHPGLIIVTPTTPEAGWPIRGPAKNRQDLADIGQKSVRNMDYTWFACFTGLPSLSVPVGYVEPSVGDGVLPVGMMGTGEWGGDEELLEWAKDAEDWLHNCVPGGRQRPAKWVDCIQRTMESIASSGSWSPASSATAVDTASIATSTTLCDDS